MKLVLGILTVLIVLAQVDLWVGDHGLREVRKLDAAIAAQREENAALAQRNQRLAAEVEDLRDGFEAVEERAREELGMIKKGETYYQIVR